MSIMQPIAQALGEMFAPLLLALQDENSLTLFLRALGWDIKLTQGDFAIVQDLLPHAGDLTTLLETVSAFDTSTPASAVEDVIDSVDAVIQVINALSSLTPQKIQALTTPLNTTAFWADLALDIPEYLTITYLENTLPTVYALLVLGGVITFETTGDDPPRTRRHLIWSQLTGLLQDPVSRFASLYNWGGALDHATLLERLALLTLRLGLNVERVNPPPHLIDQFYPDGNVPFDLRQLNLRFVDTMIGNAVVQAGMLLLPVPKSGDTGVTGLYLGNLLWGDFSTVDLSPVSVEGSADASGAVGLILQPDAAPTFEGTAAEINFGLTWTGVLDEPTILFGQPNTTRLQFAGYELELRMQGTTSEPEFVLRAATIGSGLQMVVAPGEGDNFVRGVLGITDLTAGVDIDLEWSSKTGFQIAGGAELDLTFPLNLKIFFVTLLDLHLLLSIASDGTIDVQTDVDASAVLGPFTLVVAEIGLLTDLTFADSATARGTFGGLNLNWNFKPPRGVGIGFDFLGLVDGAGFIDYDPDTGEYSGMVTVDILAIGITATAIITTQLPGIPDGWSLFLSINVDLGSLPIGFGFTLEKVGGLIGVNRTIDTAAFQSGVRTGLLDSVLFPEDPIANAPQILSDIETAFPTAPGSFVAGVMLNIGWGTPTIITASAGLVIQLPDVVIALLGQAEAVLPFADTRLVEIHFDVVGIVDLALGTLALDAGLRDSQIVGFVLTGQMALRASYLTDPSFLLAMGGFHPAFTPPADFPALDRLGFSLGVGDWLSITLEAYLALTSNTVQFGAGLYLTARLEGFSIEGGTEINTLIQFSPFQFTANLSYFISVSAASVDLLGVLLTGSLRGPNPYFVRGQARFKLLGLEQHVDIEETIGTTSPLDAEDAIPVLPDVIAALQDPESWHAVDAPSRLGVAVFADNATGDLTVHPGGYVEVVQRVAPLDVQLEHYGSDSVEGVDTLDVSAVKAGNKPVGWEFAEDWFAPAQFFDMSQGEKLDAPSFEEMKAGLRLGDDDTEAGTSADAIYGYEQIIYDPEFRVHHLKLKGVFRPRAALLDSLQAQRIPRSGPLRWSVQHAAPSAYTLAPARYVLVPRDSLAGASSPTTYAEANQKRGPAQIVVTSGEGEKNQ